MPKIFGQLEKAALEVLASDPSVGVTGRVFWNSTEGRIKIDDSAAIRGVLANDGKAVIGTSGTANNNIRFHRGANEVLQFVKGGDVTAEGTLSTDLGQISAKFETYANTGALPAAGNAGRLVYQTDVALLKMDNGSAFKNLFSGLLTTKGDLFTFSTVDARLGVGTNGQVLTADSAEATGLKWASVNPALNITSKTANYTATVSDDVILCDASGGAFTITLPPLSGILGRKILVIKTDTSVNQVTIDADGSETINGFANRKLSTVRESMECLATSASNWSGRREIPSEYVAYTPTFTGFGTPADIDFVSKRVGDELFVLGKFGTGTCTAVEARISLGFNGTDGNVTIAGSPKMSTIRHIGESTGTGTTAIQIKILAQPSVGYFTFGRHDASTAGLTPANANSPFGDATTYSFFARVPIDGWEA